MTPAGYSHFDESPGLFLALLLVKMKRFGNWVAAIDFSADSSAKQAIIFNSFITKGMLTMLLSALLKLWYKTHDIIQETSFSDDFCHF